MRGGGDATGCRGLAGSTGAVAAAEGGAGTVDGAGTAELTSTLVASGTDMVMGGGITGVADAMVTVAVGVAGGTNVIGGRVGGIGVGGVAGGSWDGVDLSPCNSSFLSSSVAIRVLMRVTVALVSADEPNESL